MGNMPIFFVGKMREAFALQKLLSFFNQKYLYIMLQSHETLNELTS